MICRASNLSPRERRSSNGDFVDARPRTIMKKVAIYAIAAVALLLLALPPVLGMLTESQVKARIAALDSSGVLRASLRTYERGWFRSRARMSLAFAPQTIA